MTTILNRADLYALVWSEPVRKLAVRFGLSDRGLGKLCERHNIPVPPRGWWAKTAAGHTVSKAPLPPLNPGEPSVICIEEPSPRGEPVVPAVSDVPEIAFEQQAENRIIVPYRLGRAHPFITRTSRALREATVYERGLLFPTSPSLGIRVSRSQIPRALRIMNALVKALEARGYQPQLPSEGIGLLVNVLGEPFNVSLMEVTKRQERPPTEWEKRWMAEDPKRPKPYELVPCGDLALTISDAHYDCYQMRDKRKTRLEEGLNRFVVRLLEEALQDKYLRAERERRRLEWAEVERIRADERRLQQEEEERVRKWNEWMSNWKRARDVREFAEALRHARAPIESGSTLESWLEWAAAHARNIDPLGADAVNQDDELRLT